MNRNNENLNKLLSGFFDEQKAACAGRDIRLGDEILESSPAPEPASDVIDGIKARVSIRLETHSKKRLIGSVAYKCAAAAVIILLAMAGVRFFANENGEVENAAKAATIQIWEDDQAEQGDYQVAVIMAEIEEIENSIRTVRLDDYSDENGLHLTEVEIEMIAINGDFWKG